MKKLIILTLFIILTQQLCAVIAYPYPITYTQPNGDTLTLTMQGDEFFNYAKSSDGYTLMYNSQGYFTYAQQNKMGDLEPSKYTAKSPNQRGKEEQKFLSTLPKGLKFTEAQLQQFNQIKNTVNQQRLQSKAFPTTGERKLICLLMQTPDRSFVLSRESFYNLFNQLGYNLNNATGSVRDFFLECSYQALDLTVDVVGPYTASMNMSYYVNNTSVLVQEGIYAANAEVDFSQYDNDEDGVVDGIFMIFAGHGREAGGGADCIWSHASAVYEYVDGVSTGSYACAPELQGASGTSMTNIGVICHEFGHTLGAPDYYDTNYEEWGSCSGTGNWDLQGSGSWNANGRTPAHPNPRSKIFTYHWAEPITLSHSQNVILPPSRVYKNAFYQINMPESGEIYLLENRQQEKFDNEIPGHGMVIYHQHADIGYWNINTSHPQKFYPVAANCMVSLPANENEYGSINSNSCPWPGIYNKQEISDTTTPAFRTWNHTPSYVGLYNIREENGVIYFQFTSRDTTPPTHYYVHTPTLDGVTFNAISTTNLVPAGENYQFTISISPAYSQSTLVVCANGDTLVADQGVYTIHNIREMQFISINGLHITTFDIIATAEENGTITPNGTTSVAYGHGITYKISPKVGYAVNEVFVDSISIGAVTEYTFDNVTEPHSIYANFTQGNPNIIFATPNELEFYAEVGTSSEEQEIMLSLANVPSTVNLLATVSGDFNISINGTNWAKRLIIARNSMPRPIYVKFEPTYAGTRFDTLKIMTEGALTQIPLHATTPTSIQENELNNISILPNPTQNIITIKAPKTEEHFIVQIFDIYGKAISTTQQKDGDQIDLSTLPSGIYLLKIKLKDNDIIKKIIKK